MLDFEERKERKSISYSYLSLNVTNEIEMMDEQKKKKREEIVIYIDRFI